MEIFGKRQVKLNSSMRDKGVSVVLINSPSNLYYYTGFTGGEAFFLMPVTGDATFSDMQSAGDDAFSVMQSARDGEQIDVNSRIITDSRYYEQVEKECEGLTLVRLEDKGYSETVNDILSSFKKQGIIKALNGRLIVALEDTVELKQYTKLCEKCEGYDFKAYGEAISEPRMVKDEEEISKIREAEHIGDIAFKHIINYIKPGVSERDIALELEFFMKHKGAGKLSFDTIVASGANSYMPHAQVTDKKIEAGDFITMDFGCVYKGYCSDMTRTVALGNPTEEMRKVYQIVLDANQRAMAGVRAGISCKEIDALARDYIKSEGYGEYFGHGLGHGVGLDIHEEPRFSPKCDVITKENMVITDEPGIYLPGKFGVRIEDLLVVKKTGCEVLSRSERELVVL